MNASSYPAKPALHWNGFPWQVADWTKHIQLLRACGFTWATYLIRPSNSDDGKTFRDPGHALFHKLKDAGFRVRLWVVGDVKGCRWVPPGVAITSGQASPSNPDLDISKDAGRDFLRRFTDMVAESGLPQQADAIACAWSGTFEIDQRLWTGSLTDIIHGRGYTYAALRSMVGALAVRASGSAVRPLCGAQRGSLSHAQPGRCNYYPWGPVPLPMGAESAMWLADAVPWQRWYFGRRVTEDELEFLAFGSALARGTNIPLIVNEHDDPDATASPRLLYQKARVLLAAGVHPAIIDARPEQILAMRDTLNAIASLCEATPEPKPVRPLSVWGTLEMAFKAWKKAGGSVEKCVPVRWMLPTITER